MTNSTANIYEYLKSLTLSERALLSEEISCSKTYMNYLASKQEGMSLQLASKIYYSDFNHARDEGEEFTKDSYLAFKKNKREERANR